MANIAPVEWTNHEQVPMLMFTVLLAALATANFTKLRRILTTVVSRLRLILIVSSKATDSDSKCKVSQLHSYPSKYSTNVLHRCKQKHITDCKKKFSLSQSNHCVR